MLNGTMSGLAILALNGGGLLQAGICTNILQLALMLLHLRRAMSILRLVKVQAGMGSLSSLSDLRDLISNKGLLT